MVVGLWNTCGVVGRILAEMRTTTTPWHIRVTPCGRPLGCDTGVPRCGLWVSYNTEIKPPHAAARPCHIPWAKTKI